MHLYMDRSSSMDINGKQKMTCSKRTSTSSLSSTSLQQIDQANFSISRRTTMNDDMPSSDTAATTTDNNQKYLMADPARPIDETSSIKRTRSQAIEPENYHNEEFPEILPGSVSSENRLLKKSGLTEKYLSSWDLMMIKRQKVQEKNSQERKR